MAIGVGYKSYLGIGKESSWGEKATAFEFVPFTGESISKNLQQISREEELTGNAGIVPSYKGNIAVSGGISGKLTYQDTDLILAAALGGGAGTPTGTGPYTHVIQLADDLTRSLSIWLFRNVDKQLVVGAKINKLTIKGEIGKPIEFDIDLIAKDKLATDTNYEFSTFVAPLILFEHLTFKIGDLSASLSDANIKGISSFELTLENSLKGDDYTTESAPYILEPIRNAKRKITLKIKIPRFASTEVWDWYLEPEKLQAALEFEHGSYNLKIELPTLLITEGPQSNVSGSDIIPVEFTMQAFINDGNTFMGFDEEMLITITNNRSEAIWA